MNVAAVIPVCIGREANVVQCLRALAAQTRPYDAVVVVIDGEPGALLETIDACELDQVQVVVTDKHEPGMEQPRNVGVRHAARATHVHFVDSDVVLYPHALEHLELALLQGDEHRTLVAPYDWLDGLRPEAYADPVVFLQAAEQVRNDPRWAMFDASPPDREYRNDLSAGLACFSGNLLWSVEEFKRVGGFWAEIHHGRCEDGELGLRAVAMDVPISFVADARGWHLWHPVNTNLALSRNQRDVPMLNERHPWVERGGVFLVDRDGKAFDVLCRCGRMVPTIGWWDHAAACDATGMELAA